MLNERTDGTRESPFFSPSILTGGRAQILRASLVTFAASGYEGASIRQVATEAGVSPSAIYHYFESKEALLHGIVDDVISGLIESVQAGIGLVSDAGPRVRLQVAIRAFIQFYIDHQMECAVLDSERRYLAPDHYETHIERRRHLQTMFDEIIDAGIAEGVFKPRNKRLASRTIMVACRDVAHWYRAGGELTPSQVADEYAAMALELIGASSVDSSSVSREGRSKST